MNAALVERPQRNRNLLARVSDVVCGSRGQWREFQHLLVDGQRKERRLFERRAVPYLFAT
jgi:hypothetical protein